MYREFNLLFNSTTAIAASQVPIAVIVILENIVVIFYHGTIELADPVTAGMPLYKKSNNISLKICKTPLTNGVRWCIILYVD